VSGASVRLSLGLAVLVAQPAAPSAAPSLLVDPREGPADAVVHVRLEGAPPRAPVTLRATAADADGGTWRSEIQVLADARGTVDLSRQAPVAGSYSGRDAMGLFWSMRRVTPPPGGGRRPPPMPDVMLPPADPVFPHAPAGSFDVAFEALAGGVEIARATATRRWTGPGVTVTEIAEDGLVGRLYEPAGGGRRPAILVLSGSNGGIQVTHAPILAGHGYVTFSLAYFRAPGLPKDLVEIPLESLKRGLDWLRARASVDPGRVAVLGISRGAEGALLLGATYPEIKAVVALAPSHVVWEGAIRDPEKTGLASLRAGRSGWTLGGRPLDFAPKVISDDVAARIEAGGKIRSIEIIDAARVDPAVVERAAIAVERTRGDVLLVAGTDDGMWPSAAMAEAIAGRLRRAGFRHRVQTLVYPGAGHVFSDSWMPASHGGTIGGSPAANARAFAGHWPRLLAFLRGSIGAGERR
jgi:dienelactone hydrolase